MHEFFFSLKNLPAVFFPGDIYEEEIWVDEEGLWAERAVWLWDRSLPYLLCNLIVYTTLPIIHSAVTLQALFQFLKQTELFSVLSPLNMLFPFSGMFFFGRAFLPLICLSLNVVS